MEGIWRGVVVVVGTTGLIWVLVERSRQEPYGPIEGLDGVSLEVGDRVLVGFREGRGDAIEIIRKLA